MVTQPTSLGIYLEKVKATWFYQKGIEVWIGVLDHINPCNAKSGSRPDSKTWRLFYFGDLWPEGLLASLTYINGPSGDRQIWKVLQWKSDKYFKMNIRTTQLNGPIQCKILFYTSVPDFVIISTTFMWYLRKNRAALGKHCIPCQDGVQKSDFVT